MTNSNRAEVLTKTSKVLKKHYKPVPAPADRSVLDHLLYACCLENSKHEDADEVMATLEQKYFDKNEVRVTTVSELAEVMTALHDSHEAAGRLKRTLQSVFESQYSFDMEHLKKLNLGAAVKKVEQLNGVTPFTLAYITQQALGGHSIPVNRGAMNLLVVLGVITEKDRRAHRVPGLERAIAKSKGSEFGSLLHQFGVDYDSSPFSPRVRSLVLEIAPDAKDRLPKQSAEKKAQERGSGGKGTKRAAKKRASETTKKSAGKAKKKSSTKSLARKKPR